jgi:hypothetical protein
VNPRALVLALTVVALVAAACAGSETTSSGETGSATGLTTTYDGVTLADGVTLVDESDVRDALRAVDDDGTLHVETGSGAADSLRPGSVTILEGAAVRRIVSVDEVDGEVLVKTADASLAEAIKTGTLGWSYAIDWNDLPERTYETAAAGAGLAPVQFASVGEEGPTGPLTPAVAGKELKFAGEIEGYSVELKLVPKPDQLAFELSAARSNIKVGAKGFIRQFTQDARMGFDSGSGTFFDASVKSLQGEAEITWAAFQVNDPSLDDDVTGFQIPLSLPIPFTVGPVPMTLSINTNIRMVPTFKTADGSSGGSFKLSYDSDHGFKSNGGTVNPAAAVRSFAADLGATATVTAGSGPTGFGLGVEFPRLELALGHPLWPELLPAGSSIAESAAFFNKLMRPYVFITLNQYVDGQFTPGTTLSSEIPPCQRASIRVGAIAGYKLSVLGMVELADTTSLWEKTIDKFKDDKPCTLTGQ